MAAAGAAARPWRDRCLLAALASSWRALAGRPLHQAVGGPGWVALLLAGPERLRLNLVCRGAASLTWTSAGPPAADLAEALGRTRRHPLASLLAGATLRDAGLLPEDLVIAVQLAHPERGELVLMQQLFGPRGNLVLLDGEARRLWSLHRSLHGVLTEWPPPATWTPPSPDAPPSALDPTGLQAAAEAHLRAALEAELGGRLSRALKRELASAERLEANLERDLAAAERGDRHRREAETLAAHLNLVERGRSEVVLPALDDEGELRIELDPSLSPAENMELRFKKARRAERGLAVVVQRLERAGRRRGELAAARQELERILGQPADLAADRLPRLLAWAREHPELAGERSAAGPAAEAEPSRPFRRYRIEGRWEVWVGRSAEENDELTHRASSPQDLWFHAQGVSGSHVVLRTGGRPQDVPKRVIEKAAALAALHSRARTSGMVPVVWTERKYVRKPRRSPVGTASLLRGKTVFATPGLAEGVVTV